MPGVRIVSDSSCDLRGSDLDGKKIDVVPLSIRFGDDEYIDGVNLTVEDFYKKMAAAPALPETAAPAPGAFEKVFTQARENGDDAVVCINISSELSATMQSAQTAAKAFEGEFPVHVVDSRSITSGLGTLVLEAAKASNDGASAEDIVALVNELSARTHVFGALNTLENLKKGGRIGGARAMLGSMLSIKPIVDISTGVVEEAAKQRTRKRSLQWLYDKLQEAGEIEGLAVYHGDAPDLEDFLSLIEPTYPRGSYRVGKIGPVIGTHGGPEIMGVTWLDPAR
jgi:DegV family protein with EDD domain